MFAVVTRWFSQSYNRKLLRNPRAEQGNHSFQLFLFSCNVRSVDFLLLSICRAHNPCTGNLFWLLKSLSLLCSTITTFNMISLVQKYNRDQRHSSYLLGLRQEYKRLMMDHIYIHKILTFHYSGWAVLKSIDETMVILGLWIIIILEEVIKYLQFCSTFPAGCGWKEEHGSIIIQ